MARREITAQSSAADRLQAAQELRNAQAELQQWFDDRRNDPTTPREIFEGVDYGPLISATDIERQSRVIAGRYDYVDYGDLSSSRNTGSTTLGGGFFVPGLGSNPDSVSGVGAPSTVLTTPSIPQDIVAPSFPPIDDRANTVDLPAADVGSRFNQLPTDPRVGGFNNVGPLEIPTDGIVNNNRNSRPTSPTYLNNDDSGAVDGTGIENRTPRSTFDAFGTGTPEDSGRTNATPGSTYDEPPVVYNPGDGGTVDVSDLSQPREAASGVGLYEVNPESVELRPNVLHNYVNWTYSIGLYMLTNDSFRSIVENGTVTDPSTELENLLFRSGGAGRKGVLGEKKDYYIDNFRFTSVIGQNSHGARSSNNFDINFDIIEPYGVALLAELVQLALTKNIEDHYEVPYLIEIKFHGYDSSGNPIPNIPDSGPKYIPIKIIDMKFNISSAATTYNVTAVPYAHAPLQDQHDAFIRESVSLQGETFEQLVGNLQEHLNQREITAAAEESREPDVYNFVIQDEDLRSSRVGFTHATDGDVVDAARQSMNGETAETIQINANSTIKSAVQALVGATNFGARFNTTGTPESEQGNEDRPLRLLKVIPVITELGPYSTSTMRYQRNITFRIETQRMYGFLTPGMPGAGAQQRGWQKEYNWIFTGKNQDIIDFNAEYNLQYFNIRNAFQENKSRVTGAITNAPQPLQSRNLTRTQAGGNTYNPAIRTASQPLTDQVSNSYRGPGHLQATDNMDNVLNNPGADMIAVDLRIIGDPDWIPQDRSILPQGTTSSGNDRIINGSLAVDTHDTFVMLKFKTPRDYNPEKGLMQIDTEQTFVQGLYRVITLESTFNAGRFEQQLSMIRVQDQVSNDSANIPPLTYIDNAGSSYDEAGINAAADPERDPTYDEAGLAWPGLYRPTPPSPTTSAVVANADPDGDGNADDPEAQIFLDPRVNIPPTRNAIEDIGDDPEFTFDQFLGIR